MRRGKEKDEVTIGTGHRNADFFMTHPPSYAFDSQHPLLRRTNFTFENSLVFYYINN